MINFLKKLIQEENLFLKYYDAQSISAKIGFFSAFIISVLTHMIAYSNLILEEHMPNFKQNWHALHAGRWFHGFINYFTFYYPSWFTGILQALFLSLLVFLIIKTFDIKNRLYALLIAGVMCAFPAIAETNLHYHDSASYFFAAFLSALAFYLTKRFKFGWLFGAPLITLILAIYQSKIGIVTITLFIWLIIYIIKINPKFLDLLKYSVRYILIISIGFAAYYLSFLVLSFVVSYLGLSTHLFIYRGIGDISLFSAFTNIFSNIPRAYSEVYYYFFSALHNDFRNFIIPNNFLLFFYAIIFILGFVSLFLIIASRKLNKLNLIIIFLLVLALPVAANFFALFEIAPNTAALTMTSYPFAFLLILPFLLWENFEIKIIPLKKIACLCLVFIIAYYASFSNYIYLRGKAMDMRLMHFINRLTTKIEPLLYLTENNEVLLIGNINANPLYPDTRLEFLEYSPRTQGNDLFIGTIDGWRREWFSEIIRHRLGLNIKEIENAAHKEELLQTAITRGVPVYPQEGSVTVIDGVVVGILSFFGRVDVEQISFNTFAITSSHTGKSSDLEFEYLYYIYYIYDGQRQRLEQVHVGIEDNIIFNIEEAGEYQFRVYVRSLNGSNIINNFSQTIIIK